MTWYGSFRFICLEGFHPMVLWEGLDRDPHSLVGGTQPSGHVYAVSPESPFITLISADQQLQQEQGKPPARFRLPTGMFESIVDEISQRQTGQTSA